MHKSSNNLSLSYFEKYDVTLQELLQNNSLKVFNSHEELASSAQQSDDNIIIFTALNSVISNGLLSGESLAKLVDNWQVQVSELIKFAQKYRSSVVLVCSRDIAENIDGFNTLAQTEVKGLSSNKSSGLADLFVAYLISTTPAVRKLVSQLEALTTPLTDTGLLSTLSIEEMETVYEGQTTTIWALENELKQQTDALAQKEKMFSEQEKRLSELQNINIYMDEQILVSNEKLLDEESQNKLSSCMLADASQKFSDLRSALEVVEFEKRKYRRQRNKSEKQKSVLENELSVLKTALKTQEEQAQRYQNEIQQLQSKINSDKKNAIAASKLNAREQKALQGKVEELQKQNNKLFSELTLVKREYETVKRGALYSADRVLDKARQKLRRSSTKRVSEQEMSLLTTSEYFNVKWYLETYQDVAEAGLHPVEHYLLYGAKEGRLPSPNFDGDWYLSRYPDVAESGVNPLVHFEMYGRAEGRVASPKMIQSKGSE